MKHRKAIVLTGYALLSATFAIAAATANAEPAATGTNGYEMSVVLDRAEGKAVQNGAYQRAILRIPEHSRDFADNTNLCVAHTMVKQFKHAHRYCEQAVLAAEKMFEFGGREDRDCGTELAIAYSNRGVLHARMGDIVGAREDFNLAIELNAATQMPKRNLNWFEVDRIGALAKHAD